MEVQGGSLEVISTLRSIVRAGSGGWVEIVCLCVAISRDTCLACLCVSQRVGNAICLHTWIYLCLGHDKKELGMDVVRPHAQGGSECLKLRVYWLKASQGIGGTNMFNAIYRESSNLHPNTTGLDQMNQVRVAGPRLPSRVQLVNFVVGFCTIAIAQMTCSSLLGKILVV